MNVWVFSICWNEAIMMPYFLRHYSAFADKIIVWDEQSDDGTREIVKACPKAELREWPYHGLDDDKFLEAVNGWYKEARGKATWVMWPDIDEILYHPDPLRVLREAKCDALPARGYGMIHDPGLPQGSGQIWQECRRGHIQQNYDKWIIWRPEFEIRHTHGRHGRPPHFSGRLGELFDFKLLHYHYFGAIYTALRNARNYERTNRKQFAWNYEAGTNSNPEQSGSVAWVKKLIANNDLVNVI